VRHPRIKGDAGRAESEEERFENLGVRRRSYGLIHPRAGYLVPIRRVGVIGAPFCKN
jgi:hypothetical protein